MACLKRYFFSVFFVLLGSFFISLSLNVSNTFALDDLVYSYSSSPISNVCIGCYNSGYRYIYATFDAPSSYSTSSPFYLSFRWGNQQSNISSTRNSSIAIFSVLPGVDYTTLSFTDSSVVVRFTDHLPGDCPAPPFGSLSISENGTYDVTNYAEAVVDVPAQVIQGDYHDDLLSINQSILICGAILLVLYFFYCIYRMLIKSTGGKQ